MNSASNPSTVPPTVQHKVPQLVLGSTSRYRKELLTRLSLPFTVFSPGVDEEPLANETPMALALRLSLAKAWAVAKLPQLIDTDCIVIGSDQTATIDGLNLIGKPETHDNAVLQLRQASGKTLTFYSGLAVLRPATGFAQVLSVNTEVIFRHLTEQQIQTYLLTEKPYDCTGSAKIETLGITLVKSVSCPDPTALVGLPLIALTDLLSAAGLDLFSHLPSKSIGS